jgi:hypothetical protein
MYPLQTIPQKMFVIMKHVLPFTGVPFQIEGNWAYLKGVSHSVQKTGVTFKYKGQLRLVKPFLQMNGVHSQ